MCRASGYLLGTCQGLPGLYSLSSRERPRARDGGGESSHVSPQSRLLSSVAVRGGVHLRLNSSIDLATLFAKAVSSLEESAVAVRGGSQLRLNSSIDLATLFSIDIILRRGGAGRVAATLELLDRPCYTFCNRAHSPPWRCGAGFSSEFPGRARCENGVVEQLAVPL